MLRVCYFPEQCINRATHLCSSRVYFQNYALLSRYRTLQIATFLFAWLQDLILRFTKNSSVPQAACRGFAHGPHTLDLPVILGVRLIYLVDVFNVFKHLKSSSARIRLKFKYTLRHSERIYAFHGDFVSESEDASKACVVSFQCF